MLSRSCSIRRSAARLRCNGSVSPVSTMSRATRQRCWQVAKKRKAFATQSPAKRHRLRIALKKLRYTAESLGSLYSPKDAELFIRRVKRLQDGLGRANDLRVGHQILAELALLDGEADPMAEAGQRMLAWHAERLTKSEPKLQKHL